MAAVAVTTHHSCRGCGIQGGLSFSTEDSQGTVYMSAIAKWTVKKGEADPRLVLLRDLAKKNIIPFTPEQEKIFNDSHAIVKTTKTYLGLRGYAIVIAAALVSGWSAVRVAKYAGVPDESLGTDAIPYVIATTAAAVAGVASMLFTGTFPDHKSDAADAKERECIELTKQFDEVGLRLVSLFWSKKPDKYLAAKQLALEIKGNLTTIRDRLKAAIRTEKEDERITALLSSAVEYVISRGTEKILLSSLENRVTLERHKKGKIPPLVSLETASASALEEATEGSQEATLVGGGSAAGALLHTVVSVAHR